MSPTTARRTGSSSLQLALAVRGLSLRLGAKFRVCLPSLEVVSGGVGLDLHRILHRIVDPLVGPQAPNRHDAIVYLADAAQILLSEVGCSLIPSFFALPGLASISRTPEPLGAVFGSLRVSALPCAGLFPPDSDSTRRETIEDLVPLYVAPLPQQVLYWPRPSGSYCARRVAATLGGSGEKSGVELEWRRDRSKLCA
jgi:hypothetical protein